MKMSKSDFVFPASPSNVGLAGSACALAGKNPAASSDGMAKSRFFIG
ncbi:hypothetical protein [Mesorhizobium sp. B4-1-3]